MSPSKRISLAVTVLLALSAPLFVFGSAALPENVTCRLAVDADGIEKEFRISPRGGVAEINLILRDFSGVAVIRDHRVTVMVLFLSDNTQIATETDSSSLKANLETVTANGTAVKFSCADSRTFPY